MSIFLTSARCIWPWCLVLQTNFMQQEIEVEQMFYLIFMRIYYHHTGCSLNIVGFFPRILESLPPLPRQHSPSIGCLDNYHPIGVTVHSHCVESFEGLLQRCRRGMGLQRIVKNTIFPEQPVYMYVHT